MDADKSLPLIYVVNHLSKTIIQPLTEESIQEKNLMNVIFVKGLSLIVMPYLIITGFTYV